MPLVNNSLLDTIEVVDVHCHVWPESLAPRVYEKFTKFAEMVGQPLCTDCTIAGLRRQMAQDGVSKAVLLPVSTKPTQVEPINAELAPLLADGQLLPFATVHPDCDDPVGVVRRVAEAGFPGIKLHPYDQGFWPHEERMFPIYDAIVEEGLYVLFHSGPTSGDVYDRRLTYGFDVYFDRYPYDKTILAHLAGTMGMQEVPEDFDFDRPGYVDLAYTLGITPDDVWLDMVHRFGPERILYGSDSPWRSEREDLEHMLRIGLTEQELRLMLSENAHRLFGL